MQVLCPGQIGIWRCWFSQRGENQGTCRQTLGTRQEPTMYKLNAMHIYMAWAGIEPGPHWWEASTLITAPPLLPKVCYGCEDQCNR